MPGLRNARSRSFPPEAASVPAARRFVRDLLLHVGHDDWVDDAQLAVTELATNVVLHAHTAFDVAVHTDPDGVCVQVWDDEAGLPVRQVESTHATTGRGLLLVEAVSTSYGMQAVGPSKVVWFCLGSVEQQRSDLVLLDRWQGLEAREPHPAADAGGSAVQARRVVLRSMPLALWLSAREHHNNLMREFSLHQQARQAGRGRVPDRLVDADRARSLVLTALRAASVAAYVDLELRVTPEQAGWFEALRDVLDQAERLAATGELLATPGPVLIQQVRHWACGQVLDQLAGARSQQWSGPARLSEPARR